MADVVDRKTRSRMMSGIRGRNTRPELAVRKVLFKEGFRYRLHAPDVPGRPDIVLPKLRTAVFVHGCFWHRHAGCKYAYTPRTNVAFWRKKFGSNVLRDRKVKKELAKAGWRVRTVWECQVPKSDLPRLVRDLKRLRATGVRR
jgi:DNA mismatch endonuclease (patch repair protein)